MTLIINDWLLRQFFDPKIRQMSISLKVRGIEVSRYKSAQFTELSLFLSGEDDEGRKVYAFIRYELYLVKGFIANILIGNNIPAPKSFVLHVRLGHAIVGSCGVKITLRASQKGLFLRWRIFAKKNGVVPPTLRQ